jgi:protein deglycase
MAKRVLVPIADGSEEIEAVSIIDVLRRAGAEVTVAGVDQLDVTALRGVRLVADILLADCRNKTYDLIALPGGGPGAKRLRDSEVLTHMLIDQKQEGRLYGAICASPVVVLLHHGLLNPKHATCSPKRASEIPDSAVVDSRVVVDGNCVTSRSPGTAMEFALALVAQLYGDQTAGELADAMLAPSGNNARYRKTGRANE